MDEEFDYCEAIEDLQWRGCPDPDLVYVDKGILDDYGLDRRDYENNDSGEEDY